MAAIYCNGPAMRREGHSLVPRCPFSVLRLSGYKTRRDIKSVLLRIYSTCIIILVLRKWAWLILVLCRRYSFACVDSNA